MRPLTIKRKELFQGLHVNAVHVGTLKAIETLLHIQDYKLNTTNAGLIVNKVHTLSIGQYPVQEQTLQNIIKRVYHMHLEASVGQPTRLAIEQGKLEVLRHTAEQYPAQKLADAEVHLNKVKAMLEHAFANQTEQQSIKPDFLKALNELKKKTAKLNRQAALLKSI